MAKNKATKRERVELHGYDGAVLSATQVRITPTRFETRAIRCRPGSFEWRYGRQTAETALYHAGIHFADLWERAGIAAVSSPGLGEVGSGQWRGLPDGRAVAISEINDARRSLGRWSTARLVDYCVIGSTASEMAAKYQENERGMSHVLHSDLKACAEHFRYL